MNLILQKICVSILIVMILLSTSACEKSPVKPTATDPEKIVALEKEELEASQTEPLKTSTKDQVAAEKQETPKNELLKSEVAKTETPKTETPKTETPKPETPKTVKKPLAYVSKKEAAVQPKVELAEKLVMPTENYTDGIYLGEAQGKKGLVKVEVTVKNNRIEDIKVLEHGESEGIAEMAFNTVKEVILKHQTVSVEGMSGATKSSQGLKDAVKAALLLSIK